MIWQGLLEYTIIAWDITRKEAEKATIYGDVIGDYDNLWGGHKLLYHRNNNRTMHWNTKPLDVGLVNHV